MIKTTIHQDFFSLLKETWQDITKYFWSYFFFLFIWASLFLLIGASIVYAYGISLVLPLNFSYFSQVGIGAFIWLMIIATFFCSWFCVSFLHLVSSKEKYVVDSYIFGFPRFFSFLLLCLLMKFFITGYGIFFLIPGIVIMVYLLFSPFIFVSDRCNIFQAMEKSMGLVSGHFFVVLWYVLQVKIIFCILLFIPFLNILALIIYPMFFPVFLTKLLDVLKREYKEKKVKPKASLWATFFVSLLGWILLLLICTNLLTK